MKGFLLFLCMLCSWVASYAQCDFPNEFEGYKVSGVYAYHGKVYLHIKGEGYKELTDTSGKFQVIGYSKVGEQGFANLACGEKIPVKMDMPINSITPNTPLTPIQSGGKSIRQGANIIIVGVLVGGLITGSSILVKNSTAQKALMFTGIGFSTIVPLVGFGKIAQGGSRLEQSKF